MKGVVFTEFLAMVEAGFGLDTTDRLLELPGLADGGAYTSVGTYEHTDLLQMAVELSAVTQLPVEDLVRGYGEHLFRRFTVLFPEMFAGPSDADEFLQSVQGFIHVEVRKLYPEAELPEFSFARVGAAVHLEYRSERPLAHFAEGLIRGCLEHFHDTRSVRHEPLEGAAGTHARFVIA
jgi:hypothetical protein